MRNAGVEVKLVRDKACNSKPSPEKSVSTKLVTSPYVGSEGKASKSLKMADAFLTVG